MSRFKLLLLGASLLACLLNFGRPSIASAQTANPAIATTVQSPSPPSGNPSALTGPEQRIALVIGNSSYQNAPQLPNPANDAQSIAQFLNAAGFEVIAATDLTQNDMIKVVRDFSAKIAARGPNTVAMIYYAGHGVQLAGENYLVPIDAKVSSETDLVSNSLRLVDVMATLEAIPSRMRIVVLDACRNNPFPGVNDAGRGLAIVDAPNGSIVGYSTAPGTEALDGSGSHSPYTSAFLHLAHQPNMPIEQLFKRVRLEVNDSTDGRQIPWESSSLTSDFYFFGDTAVAASRTPAQARMMQTASNLPSRSARQAYDYVLAEGSPEYYREFIELYPHDPLSDRLRGLLASLLQAAAWHNAVLANSPLGYKSFYDNYGNSPYAQAALKLQSQPKTVPLFLPTQLIVPPQLKQTIKLTNLGSPKDNLGINLSQAGAQVHGGNPSTGISQGNLGVALGDKTDSGKNISGKADTGQIVHLPSGVMPMQPSTETPSSDPKKIVTLPAPGTNVTTSPNGGVAGKIVTLPVGTLGKGGSNQDSKMNGSSNHVVDLPANTRPQFSADKRETGVLKLNANPSQGNRPRSSILTGKTSSSTNGNSNARFATMAQSRGPLVQSNGPGQGHGGFMR